MITKKLGSDIAYKWSSTGDGTYTIEQVQLDSVGTEIVLHIKDDCKDYLEDWKLRQIINKYSDHLPVEIMMRKQSSEDDKASDEFEVVNHKIALWRADKSTISEDEYKSFYKQVAHDFEDPFLGWC